MKVVLAPTERWHQSSAGAVRTDLHTRRGRGVKVVVVARSAWRSEVVGTKGCGRDGVLALRVVGWHQEPFVISGVGDPLRVGNREC